MLLCQEVKENKQNNRIQYDQGHRLEVEVWGPAYLNDISCTHMVFKSRKKI